MIMAIASIPNKIISWRYEIGSLFLVPLNVSFSFMAGSQLGFKDTELLGYAVGPLFLVLIVVGISRLIRKAPTRIQFSGFMPIRAKADQG